MNLSDDWDELYADSKREQRRERRRICRKDRSWNKKTDQEKKETFAPSFDPSKSIRAKIVSVLSSEVLARSHEREYFCTLRGVFKQHKNFDKNLLVIGDNVDIVPVSKDQGVIVNILPRKTFLSRQDHLDRIKQQVLAANVDQMCIVSSVSQPSFLYSLIDRYLIVAKKGNLSPILLMNKLDLCDDRIAEQVEQCFTLYRSLGIICVLASAKTGENLTLIHELLRDKTSVFTGQSGTGKTALINALVGTSLPTGSVRAIGKGAHTTSRSVLLSLPHGGYIIDTPGIRSLGIFQLTKEDIFSEFKEFSSLSCLYDNCAHIGEKGCNIEKALQEGTISSDRYQSYRSLLSSLKEERKRR